MKIKILLPLIVLFFLSMINIQAQIKHEVNSKVVNTMLQKDKKFVILDVRTADEFKEGHLKNAINIDINQPDAFSKIDKLNRNDKYIVYCRTHHRSGIATDHMVQTGFKTIYQMIDGFPGWAENKLPVQK